MKRKLLKGCTGLLITGVLAGTVYATNVPKEVIKQVEQQQVLEEYQMYGIGSVSKMFGAVAVMQLVEEGEIDLDTSLVTYIPEFEMADPRYREITPRMLLNHTSGILGSSHHDNMLFGEEVTGYKEHVLEALKTQRLKAAPGEFSVYCNDGFTLAEILVERVSGLSFTEYIRKNITQPLGMESTKTPREKFDRSLLTKTYFAGMETPYESLGCIASGGIYSTAEDLCQFSQLFMGKEEEILSQASVDEMAKPWYLEDKIGVQEGDSMFGYGLGWDTVNNYPFNQYGIQALSKGGDTTVYHSNLTVLPEEKISVAVVSSGGSGMYCQLAAQEILLEVLKEEGVIDEVKEEQAFEKQEKMPIPETMKAYAGFYQAKEVMEVTFSEEDTMVLTTVESNYPMCQEYIYTQAGNFVSTNGHYLSAMEGMVAAENGTRGVSYLQFREEANGEIYLFTSSYESVSGLGKTAFTVPIAQKIKPNVISEQVKRTWESREGKRYYLINERYSGAYHISQPYVTIELSKELPGYTKSKGAFRNNKIVDENLALCDIQIPGVLGRDLMDYQFYSVAGVEYLKVGDLTFVSEEVMESSLKLEGSCEITEDGETKWYQVEETDSDRIIAIEVPKEAAYYIYDEEGKVISTSLFEEKNSQVGLPKNGVIALVGSKGDRFNVTTIH